VEIRQRLNEVLVKLFRNINSIEEQAVKTEEYKDITSNDMHVIEAIGIDCPKNMTAVAKALGVTTGTLTISVNSLVKRGFVERVRSEEDRRVVLVSLSGHGKRVYAHHQRFHEEMIEAIVSRLNDGEKGVLEKALKDLNDFFGEKSKRNLKKEE
jgi:Transcriptional regulators